MGTARHVGRSVAAHMGAVLWVLSGISCAFGIAVMTAYVWGQRKAAVIDREMCQGSK